MLSDGAFSQDRSLDLTRRLAGYLLSTDEGEHLLTVRELAKLFEASVGSISNALLSLEQSGVISINHRGHLGSFLEHRSIGDLWRVARSEPLVFANPLPSSRRYEALAGGIKLQMTKAGVQAYMTFMRGSFTRIEALRNRHCHVVVMSTFAAEEVCSDEECIVLTLPPGSFVGGHSVFHRPGIEKLDRPVRVAIDLTSYDHSQLTKMEFDGQDNIEYVETNSVQIRRLLIEGAIDAAVWPVDEMMFHITGEILEKPLSPAVQKAIGDSDMSTAIIARADDYLAQTMIKSVIDVDEMMSYLQAVVAGKIVAEY
jgi:hypothetical protein